MQNYNQMHDNEGYDDGRDTDGKNDTICFIYKNQ